MVSDFLVFSELTQMNGESLTSRYDDKTINVSVSYDRSVSPPYLLLSYMYVAILHLHVMCMYVDAVHLRLSVNSSHCSSQEVQVNDANIVTSDVFTQNGIIHVVDKVCSQIRCCDDSNSLLLHFCSF